MVRKDGKNRADLPSLGGAGTSKNLLSLPPSISESRREDPVSLLSRISSRPPLPTRFTTTSAVATPAAPFAPATSSSVSFAASSAGSATATSAAFAGSEKSASTSSASLRSGPAGTVLRIVRGSDEERERVAGGRRVEDDEVVAGLLLRAARPLEHLADLPEQEEVREPGRRAREEAERRHGEEPVAEETNRRDGADEVGQKGVEVGRDRPEVRFDLAFRRSRARRARKGRRRRPGRPWTRGGRSGPTARASAARVEATVVFPTPPLPETTRTVRAARRGEQFRRAQEGCSLPAEKGHNRAL